MPANKAESRYPRDQRWISGNYELPRELAGRRKILATLRRLFLPPSDVVVIAVINERGEEEP